MDNPLTTPNITGCGTKRINLTNLKIPTKICKTTAKTTAAKHNLKHLISSGFIVIATLKPAKISIL